jgi:DNA uptake protein ComE-like DNA-binding protein
MTACIAVTAIVTGAFEAAAAAEPDGKSSPQAKAADPPSAAAPTGPHSQPPHAPAARPSAKAPRAPQKRVDINNASLDELRTRLPVDAAYARKIIEHRPYQSRGELMTKAGLPEGVYQAVKRNVELQRPRKAAASK